uniref:Uncharacterized protein n=1 Tax=Rhizophora mucronata TaxID=61149 RepID=A0A2P2P2F4_RHIMU
MEKNRASGTSLELEWCTPYRVYVQIEMYNQHRLERIYAVNFKRQVF